MECAYAPYNWTQMDDSNGAVPIANNPGAYANGYDVMIAKKICEANGWELEIMAIGWDGLVPALNAGQLDAQIVPVADLIADFDLDRSIGAGLAAAQQSSRAQSGGRSTGALEERTAGNFIGHGKCLLLLNADHETLF